MIPRRYACLVEGTIFFRVVDDQYSTSCNPRPSPLLSTFYRLQVVVSHHGRPTKLDLDCSEPLRCPLLSFRRSAHLAEEIDPDGRPETRASHCSDDDDDDDDADRGDTPVGAVDQLAEDGNHSGDACTSARRQQGGINPEDGDGDEKGYGPEDEDGDGDGGGGEKRRQGTASGDGSICGGSAPSSLGRTKNHSERGSSRDLNHLDQPLQRRPHDLRRQHQQQQQTQEPHQHHGSLVPARLVAVLVDGSGKGWMAARRLWSVGEVGLQALAEAGLSVGDVDQDQEVGSKSAADVAGYFYL